MRAIKYIEGPNKVKIGDVAFVLGTVAKVDSDFANKLLKITYIKFEEVVKKKKKVKSISKKDLKLTKFEE